MRRSLRIGLVVGLVVFLWVLTAGRATLLAWAPAGDFYDAQGHALLDGHLDIDPAVLSIEAFFHEDRAYMYQPPFPALLRLPVLAATDDLDGRLGGPSMVLAVLVLAWAMEHLVLESRRALRRAPTDLADGEEHPRDGEPPASRLERGLFGLLGFAVVGGSIPVFLASRSWVYHESALWGSAWTLAAVAALLRLRRDPSRVALAVLAGTTLCAMWSRASVAAGAVAAIGLVAVAALVRRWSRSGWRTRLGGPDGPLALGLAAGIPVVSYALVNLAKFGSVASIPFEQQGHSLVDPQRQAMLEANGGTLFGLQFSPTTIWHYLRPNAVELTRSFPFVDFSGPGRVFGDVQFDLVDRAGSIPTSLLALLVATAVGLAGLGWRGRRGLSAAGRRALGPVLAGTALGAVTIIPFGYVAHRYLADVMPFLTTGAVVGCLATVALVRGVGTRRAVGGMAVVLVAGTAWLNVGLALRYQRQHAPNPRPVLTAELVGHQATLGDLLGGGPTAVALPELPERAEPGSLVAVDGCAALYLWNATPGAEAGRWLAVERTEAAGRHLLRVDVAALPAGQRLPLVGTTDPSGPMVWIERHGDDVVGGVDGPQPSPPGLPQPIRGRTTIDVVLDPHLDTVVAYLGDQPLTSGSAALAPGTDLLVGTSDGRADLADITPGLAELRGDDGALCRRVVEG